MPRGIISGLVARARTSAEPTSLAKPAQWLIDTWGSPKTAAGITINEATCCGLSAVWCAVNAISGDLAKLPFMVGVREEGSRRELADDPVSVIFNRAWNDEAIPIAGRQALVANALLGGNGLAEIEWLRNGRPAGLWILDRRNVEIKRYQGRLVYEVHNNTAAGGRTVTLEAEDVFHVPGFGFNGVTGISVVAAARESFALGLAAEQYGARFFGTGGIPPGIISHPLALSDKALTRLRDSWRKRISENPREPAIIEEGMKYEAMGISPEDGQFLETRQFQIPEVARWFRMPPHKLMDLLRGTFSNIEHQSIEYVTDCLQIWGTRIEQEADRKFFGRADTRYTKHDYRALLRGDYKTRQEGYQAGRIGGWMSANEIRALEDMPPIGPKGDVYLEPANMLHAGEPRPTPPAPGSAGSPPPTGENGNQNRGIIDPRVLLRALHAPLAESIARQLRTTSDKLARHAKRPDVSWSREFHADHLQALTAALFPFADAAERTLRTIGATAEQRAILDAWLAKIPTPTFATPAEASAAARAAAELNPEDLASTLLEATPCP